MGRGEAALSLLSSETRQELRTRALLLPEGRPGAAALAAEGSLCPDSEPSSSTQAHCRQLPSCPLYPPAHPSCPLSWPLLWGLPCEPLCPPLTEGCTPAAVIPGPFQFPPCTDLAPSVACDLHVCSRSPPATRDRPSRPETCLRHPAQRASAPPPCPQPCATGMSNQQGPKQAPATKALPPVGSRQPPILVSSASERSLFPLRRPHWHSVGMRPSPPAHSEGVTSPAPSPSCCPALPARPRHPQGRPAHP